MRIFLRSTLSAVLGSMIFNTESTAIGASFGSWETIFEDNDVVAAFNKVARSVRLMGMDMLCRISTALAAAR